ncbi:DUF4190 domain-containing protein [Actinomadura keratinilytica]|uniref:DUF4190 domain-containing protein n=1 Tax=Actinomadura keratinilytica TaxID=547461 RepID=A0ABP7YYZ7_9ACTN
MSGYGGQPSGWSDPYGQQDGGWQNTPHPGTAQPGWDPYGQYSAPQQPSYGYGPPGVPGNASPVNGGAIAALVCNILLVVSCCNVLAVPGIITSSLAISRSSTDPESSRTLTVWSWVIFTLSVVIAVAVLVIAIILDSDSSSTTYDSGGNI